MDFAKQLLREALDDNVLDGAAVLAFFFLLAIFPATIFVLSVLPSLSIPHLRQAVVDLLYQVLPAQSASLFEVTVRYVVGERETGLLTFGLVLSLWSASSGVAAVMGQLNAIHDVKEKRPFWKARGTAIVLMLFLVVLGIAALSLAILGGGIQSWVASVIGWSAALRLLFATFRWIVLAAALLLALAVAYTFGPDAEVRFRYLSPGNVTAAVLIALASLGFRFYVTEFGDYGATYGNLAAVIILMLWMYMAGIAVLVGGEVNKILQAHKAERE
ncbi:MAG: YihY/virulence factor BrkB family protein [Terracidiphilus sp.]